MVCVACVPRLPFFWAPTRAPSVASGTLLERFLGARDDVVRLLETLPDRAADRCAVLVTAATAAAAAAPTVAGLAPFSIDGESAGPIMSICSSVSAAAIPAPGDPMRSSAALRTVPRRCGGGVAVTGRPLSARTAAVRCGGRGTRGLGAWISVGVCESSRLMGASPPRDGCGLVSPGECSCPRPGVCDQILHQTQSPGVASLASLRGFEALAERVVHHPGAVGSPAGGVLLKPRPGRRVKLIGKV